jgi:hypothetical protein
LLWNGRSVAPGPVAGIEETLTEWEAIEVASAMTQTDVFDDLLRLDEREVESLRVLLENMTPENVRQQ